MTFRILVVVLSGMFLLAGPAFAQAPPATAQATAPTLPPPGLPYGLPVTIEQA